MTQVLKPVLFGSGALARAVLKDVKDVKPTQWGIPGHAAEIVEVLASSLGHKLSRSEARSLKGVLEGAIRHAGYFDSTAADNVDFDVIMMSVVGRRTCLSFQGLAAVSSRGKPGRNLVTYSHQVFVGRRGGVLAFGRNGKMQRGQKAARDLDYFGKGL